MLTDRQRILNILICIGLCRVQWVQKGGRYRSRSVLRTTVPAPFLNHVEEEDTMKAQLDKVFSSYKGGRDELIPLLQDVQEELGFLPEEAMLAIGRFAGVPESGVYAVATFYAQFRFAPIGRNHIMVCRGTACHVRGAPRILEEIEHQLDIKEGETSDDLEYSLETVACIGACGLAPCITINKAVGPKMTPKKTVKMLRKLGRNGDGAKNSGSTVAKKSAGPKVQPKE